MDCDEVVCRVNYEYFVKFYVYVNCKYPFDIYIVYPAVLERGTAIPSIVHYHRGLARVDGRVPRPMLLTILG